MINSVSYNFLNNPTFCARKKQIRDADKIQRKARETFPMISPTYADKFYISAIYSKPRSEEILNKKHKKVHENRLVARASNSNIHCAPYLNLSGNSNVGNCFESAQATIATLFANGIKNVKRGGLFVSVDFIDKKTNEVVYSGTKSLDHTFVFAKMNKNDKEPVVIDTWLGITDNKDNALAKYKNIYFNREFDKAKLDIMRDAIMGPSAQKILNCDYKVNSKLQFEILEEFDEDEIKLLGSYARMSYDNILLDETV